MNGFCDLFQNFNLLLTKNAFCTIQVQMAHTKPTTTVALQARLFLRTVFDDAASLPTGFIMAQSFLDFRQHQVQHGVSYLMLVGVWYPTPTTLPQSKTRLFPSSIK